MNNSLLWIVANDSDGSSVHPRKTSDNVFSVSRHQFEKLSLVDNPHDDIQHVVGLCRLKRDNGVESGHLSVPRVVTGTYRRRVLVRVCQNVQFRLCGCWMMSDLLGKKLMKVLSCRRASMSVSKALCATPERVV